MAFLKIFSYFAITVALVMGLNETTHAQGSAFAKLDFGGMIYIEVPRNWTYLTDNITKHIDTGSEATIRLAGISPNNGQNSILIAGNAYTSYRTTSGLFRLSVRYGSSPVQEDMRKLTELSEDEVALILTPVANLTRKAMLSTKSIKSVKTVNTKVTTNNGLVCMFFEFETDLLDGLKLAQTYVCPLGNKSVKLSTSYRKSEAILFRPVVEYIWTSLRVKKDK